MYNKLTMTLNIYTQRIQVYDIQTSGSNLIHLFLGPPHAQLLGPQNRWLRGVGIVESQTEP